MTAVRSGSARTPGAPRVAAHGGRGRHGVQQRLVVDDGDRVVVDVDGAGVRVGPVGEFVHVALAGQSAADVDELPDAGVQQVPDGAAHELAVLAGQQPRDAVQGERGHGGVAVGAVVVLAAERVVVDPGAGGAGVVEHRDHLDE
ncbi:hypothetical protein BJF79_39325 [Actinomadura sp. CNU-125]|nr:hypothetical protein BJF79_39325 [Actinomadura sp. CNU-125]